MGISRHGKIWWLDIQIKGKRIRRSLRTENRNEALARYAPLREKLLEKYLEEKVEFADFCDKYIDWAWSSKPFSALREEQRLRKITQYFEKLGIVYLNDITSFHIDQFRAELKKRSLAKSTINRYLQILRGMFYRAIDWEIYKKANPLKKIRFYKEVSPIQPLSDRDVGKILNATKVIKSTPRSQLQHNFHDLCIMALNTGMRKSEILNLKWKDIKGDTIRVRGKGDKTRIIPINKVVSDILTRRYRKSEYIFDIPNRHQPDLFRRTIFQIRSKTGIRFHFHQFRHYFTTKLVENSVDFVTIGAILGHSKISTSLIYSHTNGKRKKAAVDSLADTDVG